MSQREQYINENISLEEVDQSHFKKFDILKFFAIFIQAVKLLRLSMLTTPDSITLSGNAATT